MGNAERIPLPETNPVPPGAKFTLGAQFFTQDPLTEADSLQNWRSLTVVIEYDNQRVSHAYTQADIQDIIDAQTRIARGI
jgi:hypothetical protein